MVNSSTGRLIVVAMLAAGLTSCTGSWTPFQTGEVWQTGGFAAVPHNEQEGVMARTVDAAGEEKPVAVTMSGGGEIGLHSMDATDKQKMSRALDAATGKSTSWVNGRSGIKYTITPVKKVIIQNNPFCRQYQAAAEKGDFRKATNGTACVMSDGSWHTI